MNIEQFAAEYRAEEEAKKTPPVGPISIPDLVSRRHSPEEISQMTLQYCEWCEFFTHHVNDNGGVPGMNNWICDNCSSPLRTSAAASARTFFGTRLLPIGNGSFIERNYPLPKVTSANPLPVSTSATRIRVADQHLGAVEEV